MGARVAILGCGKMGQAIAGGLRGSPDAEVVAVTSRKAANLQRLAAITGASASTDNRAAAEQADVVLLAVKPQNARALVAELAPALAGKLLVSICAGITTSTLAELAPEAAVVRAMPNTPSLIGEGMTVLAAGPRATAEHLDLCERLFGGVGRVRVLDEKHFDVVTALSGSGPAFACVILESLADGGVRMGLPRDVAVELAAQTMQGAARLVLQTGRHPAALKDEVTTPAGCTIAGLLTMEDGRIRSILARTIEEAARVAGDLGRE